MKVRLRVDGVSAFRSADVLRRSGIGVLSMRQTTKKGVILEVERKDREKAIAFLNSSCYNVQEEVSFGGFYLEKFKRRLGLIASVPLFMLVVCFAQSRVLKIEVVGSGSYYESEVKRLLSEGGIDPLSAYPEDTSSLSERVLSLPEVSYCNFTFSGGVLTVEVQTSSETVKAPEIVKANETCRIESVTVVRGRALVSVGETVEVGQAFFEGVEKFGETERVVALIASCQVSFDYEGVFDGSEEGVMELARTNLDKLEDARAENVDGRWKVCGRAYKTYAVRMD